MIRLFTAMGIGAALMYLFDPREGKERREKLSERMTQGKQEAKHAVETSKSVVEQAKETAAGARERLDSRYADIRHQANEASDGVRSATAAGESASEDIPTV